jgi:hypothetical protein
LEYGFRPKFALFQTAVYVLVNTVVQDADETANVVLILVDYSFAKLKNV